MSPNPADPAFQRWTMNQQSLADPAFQRWVQNQRPALGSNQFPGVGFQFPNQTQPLNALPAPRPALSGYQQWLQNRPQAQPFYQPYQPPALNNPVQPWMHPPTPRDLRLQQERQLARQQRWQQAMRPQDFSKWTWENIKSAIDNPTLLTRVPWFKDLPPTVRNSPQFQKWYGPWWLNYQFENFNPFENPSQAIAFSLLGAMP